MRALDSKKTSANMSEYWKLYYNFMRPHMSLDGKTPAEMTGINFNNGNSKILGLLKKSL